MPGVGVKAQASPTAVPQALYSGGCWLRIKGTSSRSLISRQIR
jgi:hypothetical protein